MHKYFLSLLLFASPVITAQPIEDPLNKMVTISQFADLIHRRFYFVTRLEKTVNFLKGINEKKQLSNTCNIKINDLIQFDDAPLFEHTIIKQVVDKIHTTNSLFSLFELWDKFITYRDITDQKLTEELVKILFIIAKNVIIAVFHENNHSIKKINRYSINPKSSPEALVEITDNLVDIATQLTRGWSTDEFESASTHEIQDINYDIHTEPIITRFYHVQRLSKSIQMIKKLAQKNKEISLEINQTSNTVIVDNHIIFKHKQIVACIEHINRTHTLNPLFVLWNDFQHFKSISSATYLKETLMLIVIVYQTFFTQQATDKEKEKMNPSLEQLAQIYHQINTLPIEELLQAIDTLTDELETIFAQQGLTAQGSLIKKIIRAYWWMPPATVIAGVLIHKILTKSFYPAPAHP